MATLVCSFCIPVLLDSHIIVLKRLKFWKIQFPILITLVSFLNLFSSSSWTEEAKNIPTKLRETTILTKRNEMKKLIKIKCCN